jgi:REP element-mobilizing transposase RayT
MWNDTEIPLAYLLTFRCYGTWLHGDERGSVDRFHNQYKSALIKPNKNWQKYNAQNLKSLPVFLDAKRRESVESAIREVCVHKSWILRAINVRTNHVHTVVSIGQIKPEKVLNAFKAYTTRKMRENRCWELEKSPWVDKGSNRYLWNEKASNQQ